MPVSKRDKKVSLTKTPKKGMKLKQKLVEDIREKLDLYNNLYVFTVHNMRNGPLKDLREEWKDSRFFFAKRKVMVIALGRSEADEVQKNLHKLTVNLVGQCGLLFTNRPKDEVLQRFGDYSKMDFAKAGFVATKTVTLAVGPLPDFAFSIEPHLRSLGLPTKLEKGSVMLREQHIVCSEGTRLTPEQASLLKLLREPMAEFKLTVVCMWSKDGSFERFKVPKKIKDIPKKITEPSTQKDVMNKNKSIESSIQETSKQILKTPNQPTESQKPLVKALSEESEEIVKVEETPKSEKRNVRRSTRTSVLNKTPREPKQSLKKLTESAKRLNMTPKQTPKNTPTKRSKVSRPQMKSEDIEMSE